MLISTKNSPSAIDHLIKTSRSEFLLIDSESRPLIQGCALNVPILQFLDLSSLPSRGLPAPKNLSEEALQKEILLPAFYIHTSGSTGHPKIIPWVR